MSAFIKNWKKKSLFSKILDFIFLALLISLFFPQGRMTIGGFVNRVKSSIIQPDVIKEPVGLNQADYNWLLINSAGETTNLSDYKGKVIFLNFWATWCPPCVGEMPGIQQLYDKFKDNDQIEFLLVSNESVETINQFIKKKKYSFPVYSTREQSPEAFSSNSIPTTFVISPEGDIVVKEVGAVNWGGSKMEEIIRNLLPQK